MKKILLASTLVILSTSSCALVELGGKMTRVTGEVLSEYGEENDGVIAKGARFGGRVNTAVGGTIEETAKKGDTGESKGKQFVDLSKATINSGIDSVSGKSVVSSGGSVVLRAQQRLSELGYNPGPADGVMGGKTRNAIAEFQQTSGLTVTRKLDQSTIKSLGIN